MSDDNDSDLKTNSFPCITNNINELTMKLLVSRTNYAKYLVMNDDSKYKETQRFIEDCSEFKEEIMNITKKMCENEHDTEYCSDVNDAFDVYARTLIRYLEVKRRSDELQKEYEDKHSKDDEDNII
jgi:hypothetical protein